MDDIRQQVVDRLKQANNILVTVRTNPTVDLLSACIGLALVLDKLDKHAAAVFSGEIPSAIEFLKPEETIEANPDSLRDFIIALDKSKADKLRYKVEDKVVRIFITPYKTSISQDDLQFSQGDFNVDVVVALGAHEQQDLDQAIMSHGRILHDATVVSINNTQDGNLGSLSWCQTTASSVCEMVAQVVKELGKDILDEQIATALLTGIVAETARFSNEKTTPKTMSLAGDLMAAGANQQLVATELQAGETLPPASPNPTTHDLRTHQQHDSASAKAKDQDGTLQIKHGQPIAEVELAADQELPVVKASADQLASPATTPNPSATDHALLPTPDPLHLASMQGTTTVNDSAFREDSDIASEDGRPYLVGNPTLPGNVPKGPSLPPEPSQFNPLLVAAAEPVAPILSRDGSMPSLHEPALPPLPPNSLSSSTTLPTSMLPPSSVSTPSLAAAAPPTPLAAPPDETLEQLEESVRSPHVDTASGTPLKDLDVARSQVLEALKEGPQPLEPLQRLNAEPFGGSLHDGSNDTAPATPTPPKSLEVDIDNEGNLNLTPTPKSVPVPPASGLPSTPSALAAATSTTGPSSDEISPPPVPPPFTPRSL